MRVLRVAATAAIACALVVGTAAARGMLLDNGQTGEGNVYTTPDEFGAFGEIFGSGWEDGAHPTGQASQAVTSFAGAILTIRDPATGNQAVVVLALSTSTGLFAAVGDITDGVVDGVMSTFQGVVDRPDPAYSIPDPDPLKRILTSSFNVSNVTAGFDIDVDLKQELAWDPTGGWTRLDQTYTIHNNTTGGITGPLQIFIDFVWDARLQWANTSDDDVVGVRNACSVYLRDPAAADQAIALGQAGPAVRGFDSYYGAKVSELAPTPVYKTLADLFLGLVNGTGGLPTLGWSDTIANVGPVAPGAAAESGPSPGGEGVLGLEYRFSLAPGQSDTAAVRRTYGAYILPCLGLCGDRYLDPQEACDTGGVATATCNTDCTLALCGDGQVNAMAQEACDPGAVGVDSATCNADCTLARCGDGHVNAAAGEECEAGEFCDMTAGASTCKFSYEVGGGCGGCASRRPDGAWGAAVLAIALACRRRRRRTR